MAVYAIGDVQGCYAPLRALLERIGFDAARDSLWFTGDLVNRGPQSVEVLRFVKGLDRAVAVLGNHDLHLLATAAGMRAPRRADTFSDVLAASDRDDLLDWLRARPLFHRDDALGFALVHAGILPGWNLGDVATRAREAEAVLRGPDGARFFECMYGDEPAAWSPDLKPTDRVRLTINACTRLRYCRGDGSMELTFKGSPQSAPAGLTPWFRHPQRRQFELPVVFGHWSTLGAWNDDGVVGLDSGCLWGGRLTAVRLDGTRDFLAVPCPEAQRPGREPSG
jgi:bis(5'-nucleosyl)-tetraphosphatase (symmetrical)